MWKKKLSEKKIILNYIYEYYYQFIYLFLLLPNNKYSFS